MCAWLCHGGAVLGTQVDGGLDWALYERAERMEIQRILRILIGSIRLDTSGRWLRLGSV